MSRENPISQFISVSSLRILGFCLVFRLLNALFLTTYFNPDEFWQNQEVAYDVVFGDGQSKTWEWRSNSEIRGYTHPASTIVLFKLLALLHLDFRWLVLWSPRLLQAVFAAVGDVFAYRLALRWSHNNVSIARWTLFAQLTCWFGFHVYVRPYSNSLESMFTNIALTYWPFSHWTPAPILCLRLPFLSSSSSSSSASACASSVSSSSSPPSKRSFLHATDVFIDSHKVAFAALACALVVRPTSLALWTPLIAFTIYRLPSCPQRVAAMASLFRIVSLAHLIACVIDYVGYGHVTFPAVNFFRFNVDNDIGRLYGTHPWYWMATSGLGTLLTAFLPCFLLGAVDLCHPSFRVLVEWLQSSAQTPQLPSAVPASSSVDDSVGNNKNNNNEDSDDDHLLAYPSSVRTPARFRTPVSRVRHQRSVTRGRLPSPSPSPSPSPTRTPFVTSSSSTPSPAAVALFSPPLTSLQSGPDQQRSGLPVLDATPVAIVLWTVFIYSLPAHKEPRFLLPALTPALIVAAYALHVLERYALGGSTRATVVARQSRRGADDATVGHYVLPLFARRCCKSSHAFSLLMVTIISISLLLAVYFGRVHQSGPDYALQSIANGIRHDMTHPISLPDSFSAADATATSASATNAPQAPVLGAFVTFLMPCHSTPYASALHGLGLKVLDTTPTVTFPSPPSPRGGLRAVYTPRYAQEDVTPGQLRLRYLDCSPAVSENGTVLGSGEHIFSEHNRLRSSRMVALAQAVLPRGTTIAPPKPASKSKTDAVRPQVASATVDTASAAAAASVALSPREVRAFADYAVMFDTDYAGLSAHLHTNGYRLFARVFHAHLGPEREVLVFRRYLHVNNSTSTSSFTSTATAATLTPAPASEYAKETG